MTITEGHTDFNETSFVHRLSVLSADGTIREDEPTSIAALGTGLPQLISPRNDFDLHLTHQQTGLFSSHQQTGLFSHYNEHYETLNRNTATKQELQQIANQLGHIKDVQIEHGPPDNDYLTRAVTFGENPMSQIKEERKRKKKKVSSQRVFGVETVSPRQPIFKTRNIENTGSSLNASPSQTKRSTLKMANATLGIDQQLTNNKKVKPDGFNSRRSSAKHKDSDKATSKVHREEQQ